MNPVTQTPLNSSAANPLQGLHDIHLPASPELWPLAPGWWIVLGISSLAAIIIAFWWWRKRRWQQFIMTQIEAVLKQPDSTLSQQLAGLSAILRRVALKRYPREQVAALHGQQWLDFLQQTSHNKHFNKSLLRPLAEDIYQHQPDSRLLTRDDPMVQLIIHWIQENLS